MEAYQVLQSYTPGRSGFHFTYAKLILTIVNTQSVTFKKRGFLKIMSSLFLFVVIEGLF